VLGLAFGFGWTPCIGPILGAILALSALSTTTSSGVTLLALYSAGLGLPFLGAAMFTDALLRRRGELGKAGRLLRVGTGAVMIAMGAAMVTGTMTTVSFWLLDTFPWLSNIG
jgi:cytochrome c-type biogenesis protein